MRVLFLSRWYPYPADNGSKIRISGLLDALCAKHDVTLVSFHDPAEPPAPPPAAGPVAVRRCPFRAYEPASRRALAGLVSSTPRYLVDTYRAEMDRLIRDAVRETRCDLVIASEVAMAAYHESFRGTRAMFEDVELGIYSTQLQHPSALTRMRRRLTWSKHCRYLSRIVRSFACCTVPSEIERRLLAEAAPGYEAVHVVPNSVRVNPVAPAQGERAADTLIFTGSLRYGPNREGMEWFVTEAYPAIRAARPGVRLTITGDAGDVPFPASADVVLTGRVPDVRPLVEGSMVSVAPLRSGSGTRIKILEAMAVGTPVVATSIAAEGLEARDGEHLLIADTPGAFARAVVRLLEDPAASGAMAERAWRFCRDRYDAGTVASAFLRLVDQAAA